MFVCQTKRILKIYGTFLADVNEYNKKNNKNETFDFWLVIHYINRVARLQNNFYILYLYTRVDIRGLLPYWNILIRSCSTYTCCGRLQLYLCTYSIFPQKSLSVHLCCISYIEINLCGIGLNISHIHPYNQVELKCILYIIESEVLLY